MIRLTSVASRGLTTWREAPDSIALIAFLPAAWTEGPVASCGAEFIISILSYIKNGYEIGLEDDVWIILQWLGQSRLCQCWQKQFLVQRTWHRWRPKVHCWAKTSTERAVEKREHTIQLINSLLCFAMCHCMQFFLVFATLECFIAYSLNDTLHFGNPVNIFNECRVFQESLLESLSSYSNLRKKSTCSKQKFQIIDS